VASKRCGQPDTGTPTARVGLHNASSTASHPATNQCAFCQQGTKDWRVTSGVVYTIIHSPLTSCHSPIQLLPEYAPRHEQQLAGVASTDLLCQTSQEAVVTCEGKLPRPQEAAWSGPAGEGNGRQLQCFFRCTRRIYRLQGTCNHDHVNILAATCRTARVSEPEPVTDVVW
jgi:hypothetical protein